MKPRLALVLLAFLVTGAANAAFTRRIGWEKALVGSGSTAVTKSAAKSVAAAAGGELVWFYTETQRAFVYVPDLDTLVTKAKKAGLTAEPANFDERVWLWERPFDPRKEIPASDDFHSYPAGQEGIYLMQFAGTIDAAWQAMLRDRGVRLIDWQRPNSALVVATPEAIVAASAFDWIQWWDFHHPRRKGYRVSDPLLYQNIEFSIAAPAGAGPQIRASLESRAMATNLQGGNYEAADVDAILRHPLVLAVWAIVGDVDLFGVLPDAAPPRATVRLQIAGTPERVLFNALPGRIVRRGDHSIDVEVPQGIPEGRADITVIHRSGWRQVLPSESMRGFRVAARASETTFRRGDPLLTMEFQPLVTYPPWFEQRWVTPRGELRGWRMDEGLLSFLFGAQGFLNATTAARAYRFDAHLEPAGEGPDVLASAGAVVLARDGSPVIATVDKVTHYDASGRNGVEFSLPYVGALDLAHDQCTLAYADDAKLALYDICAAQPVRTLVNGRVTAVRFLRDGTLLATTADAVLRLDAEDGSTYARTRVAGVTAMALAADPSYVWLAVSGGLLRYDLDEDALVDETPLALRPLGPPITSIAVYGEWFAARGEPAYDDDIVIEKIEQGSIVTITGRGWMRDATVTFGGVAIAKPKVLASSITFRMPEEPLRSREVIVTNPNGQRGVAELRVPRRRAVR